MAVQIIRASWSESVVQKEENKHWIQRVAQGLGKEKYHNDRLHGMFEIYHIPSVFYRYGWISVCDCVDIETVYQANTFAVPQIPKIPNVTHKKCEEKMKVVSFVIGAAFKWLERSFWETMEREEIFQMAGFGVNQATEMGVVKKPKKFLLLLVTYFPGIIL